MKEDSKEDEVGSKRVSQQAKRAKASKPGTKSTMEGRDSSLCQDASNSDYD
jgi:hypothetical protein